MRFFDAPLAREESDALAARIRSNFAERGFGLWAIDVPTLEPRGRSSGDLRFAGFVGLAVVTFEAPFNERRSPALEIGWRLRREAWGHGYASEGAVRVLDHAFGALQRDEVVSFTALDNTPSIRVMERIGLERAMEFEHPRLPDGHPLRRHVLYRVTAERWKALRGPGSTPQGQGPGAGGG
ncbi:GNAT family N-acetyltransferase [soil metagenome]